MKAHCFICGREFDFEENEDWQECNMCGGTGLDECCSMCIFCNGTGEVNIYADELPICEDCLMKEEEDLEE